MSKPDLRDPAQRNAYRAELRRVYRGWRWLGLALVVAGLAAMLWRGEGFDRLSLGLVAAGWAILVAVIVLRTRYHRRRMSERGPATK